MSYSVTKTWGPETGLSCCFRQWRAQHSHCRFLHGYALGVQIEFMAESLDECNWVYDFGNMAWIKQHLQDCFDHKTLIAQDDPELPTFVQLHERGLIQLKVVPHTGCEMFAQMLLQELSPLIQAQTQGRVSIYKVQVLEHAANAASIIL